MIVPPPPASSAGGPPLLPGVPRRRSSLSFPRSRAECYSNSNVTNRRRRGEAERAAARIQSGKPSSPADYRNFSHWRDSPTAAAGSTSPRGRETSHGLIDSCPATRLTFFFCPANYSPDTLAQSLARLEFRLISHGWRLKMLICL